MSKEENLIGNMLILNISKSVERVLLVLILQRFTLMSSEGNEKQNFSPGNNCKLLRVKKGLKVVSSTLRALLTVGLKIAKNPKNMLSTR